MELGEALMQMMAGGETGEPQGFNASLRFLADDYPSKSAMARDLGVARSTLRGWLEGRTPRGGGVSGVVEQAQRQWRSAALGGRADAMRRDWSSNSIVVVAAYAYDDDHVEDEREVKLGEYLNDIGEALADAYLDGAGPDELEDIVVGAIADQGFYRDSFEAGHWDVTEVRWDVG